MKNRKFVMLIIIVMAIGIILFCLFSKKQLYKELGFELPRDTEVIEMEAKIDIKSIVGLDNEVLAIKFAIHDEECESFLKLLENSDKITYGQKEDKSVLAVPHAENVIDSWDFDYEKLEYYYKGYTTRQSLFFGVRGTIDIFVTKSENGERWVYICYLG